MLFHNAAAAAEDPCGIDLYPAASAVGPFRGPSAIGVHPVMWLSSVCRPPQGLSLSMWVGAGAGIAGQSRNIDIDAGFQGGSGKSMGILYKSATQLEPACQSILCVYTGSARVTWCSHYSASHRSWVAVP